MNRPQSAQEEDSGLVGEGNTARLQNVTVSMRSRSVCPPEMGWGPLCPPTPRGWRTGGWGTLGRRRHLCFLKVGQAVTSPHPGFSCSWIALPSPTPQGTSLPSTLRATQSCPCMPHASFLSPALAHATLLGPYSCWIAAGDTLHEPWWTALPPLENLPQEKHVVNSNLFLFLCFKHINYQVELRKSTCLARCPQPGMRAVNFSLGSWNPSSLPALRVPLRARWGRSVTPRVLSLGPRLTPRLLPARQEGQGSLSTSFLASFQSTWPSTPTYTLPVLQAQNTNTHPFPVLGPPRTQKIETADSKEKTELWKHRAKG